MKKIGILTFHYADNWGAVLQTYALRKAINDFGDCEGEVINYIPAGYAYRLPELRRESKELLFKKRQKFEQFLKGQCGINQSVLEAVEGNEYDIYCVGSDQVWNTCLPENVDREYFLPHLKENAKRITYAASVGTSTKEVDIKCFEEYLPKFSAVSVREKAYVPFAQKYATCECVHVLDPTMLLEKSDYEKLIREKGLPENRREPYVLFFWYVIDDEMMKGVAFVNSLAEKYGLRVVHTIPDAPDYMFAKDAESVLYAGVEEFLSLVQNAEFVVTNSYHGAIFSLQFEVPLYMLVSAVRRGRLDDLAEQFGLEDRKVTGYLSPAEMNREMDFADIKHKMSEGRKKSLEYLRGALEID